MQSTTIQNLTRYEFHYISRIICLLFLKNQSIMQYTFASDKDEYLFLIFDGTLFRVFKIPLFETGKDYILLAFMIW